MANILNAGPIVPVNKGTYSSTTTYSILNLVDDGTGQVYLSKKNNNLGNSLTNGEWWGRYTGPQGPQGVKGDTGTINLAGEYGTSESVGLHQKFLTEKMTGFEEKTEDFTVQSHEEDSVDAGVTILPGAYYDDGSYNPDRADRACCVIDGEIADRVGIFTKDDVLIKYIEEVRNGSSRSRIPASGNLDVGEYHLPIPGATVYYVNFGIASGGTATVDYFAERIDVLKPGLVPLSMPFRDELLTIDRADGHFTRAIVASTVYKNDHANILSYNDPKVYFEEDVAIESWPNYLIQERNNYLQADYDTTGTIRSGVTVRSDGRGRIVLIGTATGNNTVNYKNNWTIPEHLRGARCIIYAMAQLDASYFIRFRDANGEQVSTTSFTSQANTLLARSVSIPSTATSAIITISNAIVSGVTYNGTIYWMGLYSDGRNAREYNNGSTLTDGAERFSGLYRRISLEYQRDTKEYIDERDGYITPEYFGAAGDGVTDDTLTLQACINEAMATGKSVVGYGKYKTSGPIEIIGNHLNVSINALHASVSGAAAIVTRGSYNTIAVKELTSDGIGLLVTQIKTGEETRHCRFDIENVTTLSHCVEVCTTYGQGVDAPLVMFGNTYNVQVMESEQGHGVYTHDLYDDSSYYIGMIKTHNNWAVNCDKGVMRLYNTELEHAWAGFLVKGSVYATNIHLMEISEDARPNNGYEGWQAKLVGATSKLQFTSVSDVDVFPDLIENARDFTGVDLRDSKTNFAYCYTLGWCSSYIPFLYDTSKGYSFMQPSKVVIYGTRKAIVPSYKADLSITSSLFDNNGQLRMDDHNTVLPYKFVIDGLPNASNTLYLGESYVPVGIDEFEVVIKPAVTGELIFKDTFNRIVFDTSDKAAGTYRVKAIAPSVPTNTPAGGKLWGFLEDNFTWEVERIIDETTFDDALRSIEDRMEEVVQTQLITTPPVTLNAQVGYYYCIGGNGVVVDTMTIQLPAIADYEESKAKNVSFFMVMGSAPAVTFVSAGTERIRYQKDFALEAERGYEVNALWNGYAWVIAAVEIEIPETRIVATVNVTNTSGTTLVLGDTSNISAVEIDDVEQQSVERSYTFSTTGEHIVKYTLTDPTSINNSTFNSCPDLTSITIPDSVTSIGERAFYYCTGLTTITIPNTVTSIGSDVFYNCTGLTNITIPNSVTNIGNYAFQNCTGLTDVAIGNGVTSIGSGAFSYCTGLTSVTIPDSVTSIGGSAFSGCTGLTGIVVDSANSVYDSRDNCNAIIKTSTNELITGCKNTFIPNTVISIGNGALRGCIGLTNITIPDSVTNIGQSAFQQCGLTGVTIPDSVTSLGNYLFSGCKGLTSVTIGNSVTSISIEAFQGCSALTSITIPDSVTNIGQSAFGDCTSLVSVTIPDSVTSIGDNAFRNSGLTNITIPDGVTSIGRWVFEYCHGLTSVSIGNGVTNIGQSAFNGCSGLTSVIIGSGVTNIGDNAFAGCSGLTSVTIPDSVTSIGWSAFSRCSSLTSITSLAITAPTTQSDTFSSVKTGGTLRVPIDNTGYDVWMGTGNYYLGSQGWTMVASFFAKLSLNNGEVVELQGGGELTQAMVTPYKSTVVSAEIGELCTSIGNSAFYDCKGLTSITIPDSVTNIDNFAFYYCQGLTSVTIPDGVTNIGIYAFNESGLTTVTIGNGVTSIGNEAFGNCPSLTSVIIGSGVTSIAHRAFSNCSGLTSITCNATIAPTIQDNTFNNVKTGGTLYVPSGSAGYNVWMGTGDYYLGKYNWTKVEQ